jgi:hypothetical protein
MGGAHYYTNLFRLFMSDALDTASRAVISIDGKTVAQWTFDGLHGRSSRGDDDA